MHVIGLSGTPGRFFPRVPHLNFSELCAFSPESSRPNRVGGVAPGNLIPNRRKKLMHADSWFVRSRKNIINVFVCSFLLSFVFVASSHAQSEVYTKWIARF